MREENDQHLHLLRREPVDAQAIAAEAGIRRGRIGRSPTFGWCVQNVCGEDAPDMATITPPALRPGETLLKIDGGEWLFYGPERPVFIPLKREHFEAFASGEKCFEYRPYGSRWNERVCRVGRAVCLSLGYGKARRLHGRIVAFHRSEQAAERLDYLKIYGPGVSPVACIGIELAPQTLT